MRNCLRAKRQCKNVSLMILIRTIENRALKLVLRARYIDCCFLRMYLYFIISVSLLVSDVNAFYKQTDDSGSNEHAEDDTAAVQEDILDGAAASGNKKLVDFIRDGVDSTDEEAGKQEMLLSAEPAFQADVEKETQ